MPLSEKDYKALLIEKAPPGMEPVVKALKKKSGVDNPYAVAWSMFDEKGNLVCALCSAKMDPYHVSKGNPCESCEGEPFSAASALVRGKKGEAAAGMTSRRFREAAGTVEAKARPEGEGAILDVVLITEGLGNLRDRNYYGPEAIRSAVSLFEGAQARINHLSLREDQEQPEGRVEQVCGYYKNLKAAEIDTPGGKRLACVGELHLDGSAAGIEALEKAKTAVHYAKEFPGSDKDYVGLSINAYGDAEAREMMVDGAMLEVNYVNKFVHAESCDMVTAAGRGGKILALVESVTGAGEKNKEVRSMIMKKLGEARKALEAALAEKDANTREAKVKESLATISALEAELVKTGIAKEAKPKVDDDEMTDDEKAKKEKADKEAAARAAAPAPAALPAPAPVVEADREPVELAIKAVVKESGLSEDHFDMPVLLKMGFQEAKAHVAMVKRISAANVKAVLESVSPFGAGHAAKFSEAGGGQGAVENNSAFADCTR